jgi:hypothetical protein
LTGKIMASIEDNNLGIAWLADNGTLVIELKVLSASGPDRLFLEFAPEHPKFARILKHIGGIKPEETKEIPPDPDEDLFL